MPTIAKIERKPKSTFHNTTETRELRAKAYRSTKWQKLRLVHLKNEPLCQECLRNGRITAAEQVHHKKSFIQNGEINWNLFLDEDNLESICSACHGIEHQKEKGYQDPKKVLELLDAIFEGEFEDDDN